MRLFFLISAILGSTSCASVVVAGDAPRGVTHEDVWLMRRLGAPVPSPDGKWAVFSVAEPSYEKDGDVSDLWAVPIDGRHPPRRLTATKSPESDVAWSPDSTKIAFSAKREGKEEPSQVYVLDMTGPGEAIRVTEWATGAAAPKWSPDGRRIAFESRVYPGTTNSKANAKEKKRREELRYNVSSYETFPIRQWDRWRDDMKTHLIVQDAVPNAEAKDLFAGTKLAKEVGFGGIPSLSKDSLKAEWTPDGSGLVFSATTNLHQAAFARVLFHLYLVSVDGGEPKQLTRSKAWSCHSADFTPDGKSIVCKVNPISKYAYELTELGRLDWPKVGAPKILTTDFDRSVNDFTISDDGKMVFVTAHDQGRGRLFKVPLRAGKVEPLQSDSKGVYKAPSDADGSLVATWESSAIPAEIVRINPKDGRHTALTTFNRKRASEIDRRPYREFWFDSSRGRRIHSFLALPPAFDETKKYPLVLMIHGGPHASSLDADHVRWSPHLLASPGYVVLLTDYTGSVGYGETFSQNIQGDPLKTPGDELLEAVDEAIRRFSFIDASQLAATGASYGGHLINWLQATSTRFKTLVGHAGLVDLEGQWASSDSIYHREINNGGPPWKKDAVWTTQSPSSYGDRFGTPMMLTIGEKDYRVPINQTIAAWTYLKRKDVAGKLLVFHEANHWVMKGAEAKHYWSEVHEWLARYLSR